MDKYDGLKRFFNGTLGVGMLLASIIFSREGFGFKDGELWWVGLVLAMAATGAQFMLTSKFTDLNLGIVVLGLSAYAYSIYTNIVGIESMQEVRNSYLAWGAGIFLDIYPEMAIAWALKASREGDLVGNIMKMLNNYEALLPRNGGNQPQNQQTSHQHHITEAMQNLPRSQAVRQSHEVQQRSEEMDKDLHRLVRRVQ